MRHQRFNRGIPNLNTISLRQCDVFNLTVQEHIHFEFEHFKHLVAVKYVLEIFSQCFELTEVAQHYNHAVVEGNTEMQTD